MAADDVSLPDLEVIAQFSLAVRSATAPRAQVVAALEADLAALRGAGAPRRAAPATAEPSRTAAKGTRRPRAAAPTTEPEPPVEAAVQAASKAPAKVARARTPRARA